MENALPAGSVLQISLDTAAQSLNVEAGTHSTRFAVPLDLHALKSRASPDFRALLAVHEAGHGLAYARLFGRAPQEIKINVASFEGGYNSYETLKAESRQNCLDRICVSLAGRAAEALVFGPDACTTGSESDFKKATALAARFVRHFAFGQRLSRTDVTHDADDNINTDVSPSNAEIETLLQEQAQRAADLLRKDSAVLLKIVDELLQQGQVPPAKMAALLGLPQPSPDQVAALEPYANRLSVFFMQHELMARMATPSLAAVQLPAQS